MDVKPHSFWLPTSVQSMWKVTESWRLRFKSQHVFEVNFFGCATSVVGVSSRCVYFVYHEGVSFSPQLARKMGRSFHHCSPPVSFG